MARAIITRIIDESANGDSFDLTFRAAFYGAGIEGIDATTLTVRLAASDTRANLLAKALAAIDAEAGRLGTTATSVWSFVALERLR